MKSIDIEAIKRAHIIKTIKRIHDKYSEKVAAIKYEYHINSNITPHDITITRFNTSRVSFQTAQEAHNYLLGVEKGIECGYNYGLAISKLIKRS